MHAIHKKESNVIEKLPYRAINNFLNPIDLTETDTNPLHTLLSYINDSLCEKPSNSAYNLLCHVMSHETQDTLKNIQRACRLRLGVDLLFSPKGKAMYWHLLNPKNPDTHDLLAKLMFGKTIAKTNSNEDYLCKVGPIRKAEYDFPIQQHTWWRAQVNQGRGGYHRWSTTDEKKMLHDFTQAYLNDSPIGYNQHEYIPVINASNSSLKTILSSYLNEFKDTIEIVMHENSPIGLLKIPRENNERIKYKLKFLGIVASPWAMSNYLANQKEMVSVINNTTNKTHPLTEKEKQLIEDQLMHGPTTLHDLKTSHLMIQLAKIAIDQYSPVKQLASCMHRLLSALKTDWEYSKASCQRLYLFLSYAVMFHNMHYDRFAFLLYSITHEISLILNHAINQGKTVISYDGFKAHRDKRTLTVFGLENAEAYHLIAAPANTGSHAFNMAIELAKKTYKAPRIKIYGASYYEFNGYGFNHTYTNSTLADIYLVSSGPIAVEKTIHPGIDINLFISQLLNRGLEQRKTPVTILIDTTSGLDKHLTLNESSQKLLTLGKINVLCHASYQKFGLAHTDQVQGGIVYGIQAKNPVKPIAKDIESFQINAQKDLERHIDMIIVSFIQQNAGPYLEQIKQTHFINGKRIKDFFKPTPHKSPTVSYPFLSTSDDILFTTIHNVEDKNLFKAVETQQEYRQGFGHYNLTYSTLDTTRRLSPGASDQIDMLIQISQLCLSSQYNRCQLFELLNQWPHTLNNKRVLHYQILFTGLLLAIKNESTCRPELLEEQKNLLTEEINTFIKSLPTVFVGRKSVQALCDFALFPNIYLFTASTFFSYLLTIPTDEIDEELGKYQRVLEELPEEDKRVYMKKIVQNILTNECISSDTYEQIMQIMEHIEEVTSDEDTNEQIIPAYNKNHFFSLPTTIQSSETLTPLQQLSSS